MRPQEAALFAQWEAQERAYPWTQKNFEDAAKSQTSRVWVWEENGPVGYGVMQAVGDEAYLSNIMVAPALRRQGNGAKLLRKMMIWAKGNGANRILLDVDPANVPAVRLYESLGFEFMGRRPRSYPNGEDALLMRKNL